MEEINGLQDFSLIDFAKTAGNINNATKEIYYERKNNRIRMYDANHVIKVAGNNIEFLNLLKSLNINQVNSPDKI